MMNRTFTLLLLLIINCLSYGQITSTTCTFPTSLDAYRIVDGDTIIGVYVKSSANRGSIEQLGIKITSSYNTTYTGHVSLANCKTINENQSVDWMVPAGVLELELDESSDVVYSNIGRQAAEDVTGEGVIIGIYDTGIDFNSDDFKNEDGTTRILNIWDQITSGNPPDPVLFNYGYEWTETDINNGYCTEKDSSGHGTHVARIAAGNGRSTGNG